MSQLERAMDEKEREIRELSIQRAELIQQLDSLQAMLKELLLEPNKELLSSMKSGPESKVKEKALISKLGKQSFLKEENAVVDEGKKKRKKDKKKTKDILERIDAWEPDRKDVKSISSYRERMILMNRIDIYRLFTTVIIISSEIKYPRILSKIEEKELRVFLEDLSEFESMILDLKIDENMLWEKGKVCEKQILQLFTRFFNV